MDTNQTVAKKSKQFAIHVMKLVEHLRKNKRPYFIIDQVGRSGTSIGANVMECDGSRACYHTEGVSAENVYRI